MFSRFCGYLQFNIFNTESKGKKCQDFSLLDNCRWEERSIVTPLFWPLEKVVTFEIVAGTVCHFSVVSHSSLSSKLKFFLSFLVFISLFLNHSYACVRQINKFNHQTSFWNCTGEKFCVLKWVPKAVQLTRIPAHKERKCIRAIYMSHLEEQSRSKAHSCSRLSGREVEILWERSCCNGEKLTDAFNVFFQNQMSGELLRKFKTGNRWQKLWVVFTNFCLFFYKTHEVWTTDN